MIAEWNTDAKGLGVSIASVHEDVAKCLVLLKKTLLNEFESLSCKHPKKSRDMAKDGIVYCMDCNGNLTEEEIMSKMTTVLMKEKIQARRKFVKKYTIQGLKEKEMAKKLDVSLSTIEKDMVVLQITPGN